MKFKYTLLLCAIVTMNCSELFSQVWFPEGVYPNVKPVVMTVDNQIICAGKISVDINNSYWLVSVYDGKVWNRLPVLTLSRGAELLDIRRYKGLIYISGNFTFGAGSLCGLVRFNGTGWEGLAEFKKSGNLPASVTALSVFDNHLLLGGNFIGIGTDTMPFLMKFNGTKFSRLFDCKDCDPDNVVIDICSNDSVLAISGNFTKIKGMKSKYLLRLVNGSADTFVSTPKVMEKLALRGEEIFATAGLLKEKHVYQVTDVFTDINTNLDSGYQFSEILVWNNQVVVSGNFRLNSSANARFRIARWVSQNWVDISNNFKGGDLISTGRGVLIAAGEVPDPISVWNPNRCVMRFYPGMCLVKAKAFIDSNNNCIREPNEKPVSKTFIKLPGLKGVYTTESGQTEFMIPNEVSNTFRFVIKPFRNIVRSNCSDTSVTKTFNPGQYLDSIQFPLNRLPNIRDIRVSIASPKGRSVVKDKRVLYYMNYENMGSATISGRIYLKKSKYLSSEYAVPALNSLNDSVAYWDYSQLQPGESRMIYYTGLAASPEFADMYRFDAGVSSEIAGGGAQFTEDDSDSIPQEVESSLSAFRKDVFPTPYPGDSITYVGYYDRELRFNIAFNNFNTDTVFYAVVIDTLDLNLDMSYITVTGSNKNFFTEVQSDPANSNKGILIWHFPNIKLAPNPSGNYEQVNSGSYIGFKVNSKPLSNGYTLKNIASVYYDNQYAGTTNAVYVRLSLSSLDEVSSSGGLKVYPNPASSSLDIEGQFHSGDRLMIYSADGRLIENRQIEGEGLTSIGCSDWSAGVYRILLYSADKTLSTTLLIAH